MKKSLLFLVMVGILLPFNLFAQKFEIVDQAEYEEYYKKPTYVPDVRFHGNYQFYSSSYQDATNNTNRVWQDFELSLTSEVQENARFFLNLTNTPYEWGNNSRNAYNIYDSDLRSENNENIEIRIKELYLEYQFNPLSFFRIGRQKIQLGDELGLVYRGEVDAFSFSCRLGTWCLEFGQGNLDAQANRVTWTHFFYPIYESAEITSNYWVKNKQRKSKALNVNFYRIDDKQNNLALAKHGGRTYSPINENGNTIYAQDHFQDNNNDKYVFYDRQAKTYGLNLDWLHNNFSLHFYTIHSLGSRDYYYEDNTNIPNEKRGLVGTLYRLEWRQLFQSGTQIGWVSQSTSGKKKQTNPEDNVPWLDDASYYEWNRGSYNGSLIYFGSNYRGQQHSIHNIIFHNFHYKFYDEKTNISAIVEIFQFSRKEKVLARSGKLVSNIGSEINFHFTKRIAENLDFQLDGGYFLVDEAYSPRSIDTPSNIYENITQYSIGVQYKF